jgi:hypothetical protein
MTRRIAIGGRPASGKSRLLADMEKTGQVQVVKVDDISSAIWKESGPALFHLLGVGPLPSREIRRLFMRGGEDVEIVIAFLRDQTRKKIQEVFDTPTHPIQAVEFGGILWVPQDFKWDQEIWIYRDEEDRICADLSRENAKEGQGSLWTRAESIAWADLSSPQENKWPFAL